MMSGQSTMGMDPMQYYVGSWSCMAGPVGQTPSKATATYTLDSGVMRGWVLVPPQGKMKTAYALEIVTTYDAKNHRFVQIQLGNDSNWSVDYAKPWTGNTEQWVDHANSMPPSRSQPNGSHESEPVRLYELRHGDKHEAGLQGILHALDVCDVTPRSPTGS